MWVLLLMYRNPHNQTPLLEVSFPLRLNQHDQVCTKKQHDTQITNSFFNVGFLRRQGKNVSIPRTFGVRQNNLYKQIENFQQMSYHQGLGLEMFGNMCNMLLSPNYPGKRPQTVLRRTSNYCQKFLTWKGDTKGRWSRRGNKTCLCKSWLCVNAYCVHKFLCAICVCVKTSACKIVCM